MWIDIDLNSEYNCVVYIYGTEAFDFKDNAIVVSIPFNRLDLDNDVQDDVQDDAYVQDDVQDDAYVQDDVQDNLDYITPDQIESKILELCTTARSALEITDNLRIKGRKTVSRYIRKLLNEGKIAMTSPEKPKSKNQKYIAIK